MDGWDWRLSRVPIPSGRRPLLVFYLSRGWASDLFEKAEVLRAGGARAYATQVAAQSRRASGNPKWLRNELRGQIAETRAAAGSAEATARNAANDDFVVGYAGMIEAQATNQYEGSFDPVSVAANYKWDPLW